MAEERSDQDEQTTAAWRGMLTGEDRSLARLRRMWGRVPSAPRCKVCAAPFSGPGRLVTRILMGGRATTNPLVCDGCFRGLRKHRGGAEVALSVLFADVRGSTALAERTGPAEYSRLLQRFYVVAEEAIERADGILDKFLGDGVMALFIPVIAGQRHAAQALEAGRDLLSSSEHRGLTTDGLLIGAGVHTGVAFAGSLGSGDHLDFTALGDTVNVAARLGSMAQPGELLVSTEAWHDADPQAAAPRIRRLEISGRSQPLDVAALQVTEHAGESGDPRRPSAGAPGEEAGSDR
jgi:adenylate cyclase